MAYKILEGVQQFVTGTGTGALNCGMASSVLFRALDAAGMQDGDRTRVRIQDVVNFEDWEVVLVEYNDGVIERIVDEQFVSRTGGLINFGNNDKLISSVVVGKDMYSHPRFTMQTVNPDLTVGDVVLDVVNGGYYQLVSDGNIASIELQGLSSGMTVYLEITGDGNAYTQNWGDWIWIGPVPTLTTTLGKSDLIKLFSPDGVRVLASQIGANFNGP